MRVDPLILSPEHLLIGLGPVFVWTVVAHAVNTFPTPKNEYGAWALGVVQFVVGQRVAAKNTLNGRQSVITAIPKE